MLTNGVLSVFDSIRQKDSALLQKYTLLTSMHIYSSAFTNSIQGITPDEMILQSLLAAYDHSTNAHARRIVFFAEAVAYQLHLSDEEVFLTSLAALLHDIGKIGIPEGILNKRGPLDERELQLMRCHPEIGQQMLMLIGGIFACVSPVVVAHHENWDGSGYPARLVGEEIPLAARIIAVVDSYDAMTYRRAYHEPLSVAEACAELQRCAGSQYDAHIVTAFLSLFEKLSDRYGQRARRSLAANAPESAGVVCVMPSLQFDEFVPVSA